MRSVTVTSMMFMMPMPPTSREMPAMAPSTSDCIRLACSISLVQVSLLYTLDQPFSPSMINPWRKVRSLMTASWVDLASLPLTMYWSICWLLFRERLKV